MSLKDREPFLPCGDQFQFGLHHIPHSLAQLGSVEDARLSNNQEL